MSAVFNASGDGLTQSNNVAATSPYTGMCWAKITSSFAPADYITVFGRQNVAGDQYAGCFAYNDGVGLFFEVDIQNHVPTVLSLNGPYLTLNQWTHIAYVFTGATHRFYLDGVLIASGSLSLASSAFTDLKMGFDGFLGVEGIETSNFREWNDGLNTPEVQSEMNSSIPFTVTNLVTDTPLESDLLDDSGNGNNWSSVGSVSFGTSIAIPTNASPVGAIDITTLPYGVSQDMYVDGVMFDAWYKHTGTGTYCLGIWGFGNLTDFFPRVRVYESDGITQFPAVGAIDIDNVPLQVPFTIGVTLLFRYSPSGTEAAPGTLNVNAELSPGETIPLGSICVPDDNDAGGFHLAILSAIDGDDYHVLNFKEFPCSENADILDNGMILVHDKSDNTLHIRNADYTEFMSLGSFVLASTFGCIRQCRGTQRWWVLYLAASTYRVRFVQDDGTLGTAHDVAALASAQDPDSLAVSNDEATLYYGENTTGARTVQSFNLLTDTLIGTFATAPTGDHAAVDILVLSDDSVVVYWARGLTFDIIVTQYSAAGATLTTKNLGSAFIYPSGIRGRMAYSLDDPNSVWVWTHVDSPAGVSRFQEIELATGNILTEIDQQQYEEGEYNSVQTDTPVRFGNSFSCPFWVATQGVAPPETATLTVGKVTDPFAPGIDFIIDVEAGLIPSPITLQTDEEHVYVVVPGTYSVVEQQIDGFHPVYLVSNDPTNDNLNVVVAAGENVSVVIVNGRGGGGTFTITPSPPTGLPTPTHDQVFDSEGALQDVEIPNPFFIIGGVRDH